MYTNKAYDLGLLVGRFQHIHVGHESLIETGLKLCDRMLILVGSSQETGTLRNPFDISTRMAAIHEIYGDKVTTYAMPDLSNENDINSDWGKYVLQFVERFAYKPPDIMIYGNDEARSKWFDPEDIKNTLEVIVPRSKLPISATKLREMMVCDNRKEWMQWVNPKLHKMYDTLRAELLATKPYRDMFANLIQNNM